MQISKKEIIDILKDDTQKEWLFSTADKIRKENLGDEIHLRGLIEFSNICKCNCKYCGLRCENKGLPRYRMTKEEIVNSTKIATEQGYKTIVLQSGEDSFFTQEKMCEIISEIKKFDTALTLSIGERCFEDYKAFKEAGADRYLLRIETTDKILYEKMHPNMSFENRKRCLKDLKTLGYEVGSGCLVGLPDQTIESLADDILFFKEINADMIGIGPFIPNPATPLKDAKTGNFELSLKVMALTRLLLPDINIPATTAMETIHPNGRLLALQCGANVVMPNVTAVEYQKKYAIYPNKSGVDVSIQEYRQELAQKFATIERTISTTYGNHKK